MRFKPLAVSAIAVLTTCFPQNLQAETCRAVYSLGSAEFMNCLEEKLKHVTVVDNSPPHSTSLIIISGINVVIQNDQVASDNTGNLVVGQGHSWDFARNSFVSGSTNTITSEGAAICGGLENRAIADYAVAAGGQANESNNLATVALGGQANVVRTAYSTVNGGSNNNSDTFANSAFILNQIGGGHANVAHGLYASVNGGDSNMANGGNCSTNLDCIDNTICQANGRCSADPYGLPNTETIVGGRQNSIRGFNNTICGGRDNEVTWDATDSAVVGGYLNTSRGDYAVIMGGAGNRTLVECIENPEGPPWLMCFRDYMTVLGGRLGVARGGYLEGVSTVCGGFTNEAWHGGNTVCGGWENTSQGRWATISGGKDNWAQAQFSAICGGRENKAFGIASSIQGGFRNVAKGENSAVNGGHSVETTYENGYWLAGTCHYP